MKTLAGFVFVAFCTIAIAALLVLSVGIRPYNEVIEFEKYENIVHVIVHQKNRVSIFVKNDDGVLVQKEFYPIQAKYFDDVLEGEEWAMWKRMGTYETLEVHVHSVKDVE